MRKEIEILLKDWYFDALYIVVVSMIGYFAAKGAKVIWDFLAF